MKCKFCQSEIEHADAFCPHCGAEQPHEEAEAKKGSKKWLLLAAVCLLVVAVAGGGIFYLSKGRSLEFAMEDLTDNFDDSPEGAVKRRVKEIYADIADHLELGTEHFDSLYCSKFYWGVRNQMIENYKNTTLIEEPYDWNHWGLYWGDNFTVRINEVKVSNEWADVKLELVNKDDESMTSPVELQLEYENGNWFVMDFIQGTQIETVEMRRMAHEYSQHPSRVNYENCGECYEIDGSKCLSLEQILLILENKLTKEEVMKMAYLLDFEHNDDYVFSYATPWFKNENYSFCTEYHTSRGEEVVMFYCRLRGGDEEYKTRLRDAAKEYDDSLREYNSYSRSYSELNKWHVDANVRDRRLIIEQGRGEITINCRLDN